MKSSILEGARPCVLVAAIVSLSGFRETKKKMVLTAIGSSQLTYLESFIHRQSKHGSALRQELAEVSRHPAPGIAEFCGGTAQLEKGIKRRYSIVYVILSLG